MPYACRAPQRQAGWPIQWAGKVSDTKGMNSTRIYRLLDILASHAEARYGVNSPQYRKRVDDIERHADAIWAGLRKP